MYKHLSYGLNCSQDIFQKKMDQAFERCKGAIPIADDIQVYGTENTHDLHYMKLWRELGVLASS